MSCIDAKLMKNVVCSRGVLSGSAFFPILRQKFLNAKLIRELVFTDFSAPCPCLSSVIHLYFTLFHTCKRLWYTVNLLEAGFWREHLRNWKLSRDSCIFTRLSRSSRVFSRFLAIHALTVLLQGRSGPRSTAIGKSAASEGYPGSPCWRFLQGSREFVALDIL